jgi:phosphoribosyl 1,2-cyclic phosphodiesterase
MKLKCLGSGSYGNCYLLTADNGETLLLDAGLPIMDIKRGLNWNIKCVVGAICTHAHKDHSLSVQDLEHMGIPVFKPYESLEPMEIGFTGGIIMAFDLTTLDGKWTHTNADGTECPCYGFLITHPEMGKLLYITDTEFCKWRFADVNHILISCNYQKKYIDDENVAKRNHVFRGHMELGTVKDFVMANKTDSLQNVILCHLSRDNAEPSECVAEVKKIAPMAYVDVAQGGKEWILRNGKECPF